MDSIRDVPNRRTHILEVVLCVWATKVETASVILKKRYSRTYMLSSHGRLSKIFSMGLRYDRASSVNVVCFLQLSTMKDELVKWGAFCILRIRNY